MLRKGSAFALVLALAGGCGHDTSGPADDLQLSLVAPVGGSVNVDVNTVITIEFTHAMMNGMEQYVALTEGDVTGPAVAGSWTWSQDRKRLVFTPGAALKAATRYTIHVGGGLRCQQNQMIGFGRNGSHMGGQWATGQMMSGTGMMGAGWQHANGTYGMIFTFTTR